jgi:hypothetical protein
VSDPGDARSDAPVDDPLDQPPFPYGLGSSIEGFSSTASPLFAGFSAALVGLVLTAPESTIRWPSAALALHTAATIAFVVAVQCGLWARGFVVSPAAIAEWWPGTDPARLRNVRRLHRRGFGIWRRRFHLAYRVGIVLFLSGLAVALVPPDPIGWGRWVAIGVAIAGLVLEFAWIAANEVLAHEQDWAIDEPTDRPPPPQGADRGSPGRLRRAMVRAARVVIPVVRVERRRD